MYQVFARKWRPATFDELVGQREIARTLANAIEADRLAHAYIFAGLRGTGKTTVARILAKCVNCEKGPTPTPCGSCPACIEIAESRAIDVLEIDAASRTKVEQTRELLEMVSYAPARDRFKILIIDEAHMLSKASFNALLKTLEEPPPNVLFMLATTELQKVLPTILSRCQVFEFRRVGAPEVAGHLRKICDDEKIRISDGALDRIARAGEGSVRDSLSVLERVAAFCGDEVADEDVLRVLGAVHTRVLADFVTALAARDAGAMLTVLDELVDEGHDLVHFWGELIAALRDLLLLRALPDRKELLARTPDEAESLAESSAALTREDLTRAFQILADLEPALKSSSQPRFLFEATLIRLAGLGSVRPIEELLQSLGDETPTASARPAAARPATTKPTQKKKLDESPPAVRSEAGLSADFVKAVADARPMIGAMLEQSTVELRPGALSIRPLEAIDAIERQLKRDDTRKLFAQYAEQLTGGPVKVEIESASADAGAPSPRPASEPKAPRPRIVRPQATRKEGPRVLEEAKNEPGIKKLLDTFGARVVDVKSDDDGPAEGNS